jgi:hypothetical protein
VRAGVLRNYPKSHLKPKNQGLFDRFLAFWDSL